MYECWDESVAFLFAHDEVSLTIGLRREPAGATLVGLAQPQTRLPQLPQLIGGSPPGLVHGVHFPSNRQASLGIFKLHLDHCR